MTVYEKEKDMVSRRETVAVSFEKAVWEHAWRLPGAV